MAGKPIDYELTNVDASLCSCIECDSIGCFTKRRHSVQKCNCDKCKSSKTCLFYSNRMIDVNESESDIKETKWDDKDHCNVKITKDVPCVTNEPFKEEDVLNDVTKTKLTLQQESLPKIPPIKSKNDDFCKFVTIRDKPLTLVHSVTVTRDDIRSPTAKLSAQIMNVPYNDFKNSISFHKPEEASKAKLLSKFDILNRIKEAYKACSCKVCECIDGITLPFPPSTQIDVCNCKPCQCDDCRRIQLNLKCLEKHNHIKRCSCVYCAKEKCAEVRQVSDNSNCGSKTKPCDCKPCQCIECTFMGIHNPRTIIVAPVGEDTQRAVCQCSPCDCLECGHVYGTINTNLTHEMSTGVSRNINCRCETCLNEACDQDGTDICACETHDKIMRKPVQRDTNDYDIRSTIICNVNPSNGSGNTSRKSMKHDTIAMYASFSNTYPIPGHRSKHTYSCSCDDCQCIRCNNNNKATVRSLQNMDKVEKVSKSVQPSTTYKFSPSECQVCAITKNNRNGFIESNEHIMNCTCEVCDCIHCASATSYCSADRKFFTKPVTSQSICKCAPCECIDCMIMQDNDIRYSGNTECHENVPINKGEILTVLHSGTLHKEISKDVILHNHPDNARINKPILSYVSQNYQNPILYQEECTKSNVVENPNEIPTDNNIQKPETINITETNITRCNPGTDLQSNINQEINNNTDNVSSQVSTSYISAMSSNAIFVNNSGSISPVSKKRPKRPSSCNSSGHDHSDYLIRFPRTPAETCINEVMNLDRNLNLHKINVPSKVNSEIDDLKSSFRRQQCENRLFCGANALEPDKTERSETIFHQKECANWCSGKVCDCNPCDCDKCSFSKLKLKRCRCDCVACHCSGACHSEDQYVYIRKNEGTQTRIQYLQDSFRDSSHAFENRFVANASLFLRCPNSELEVSKDENNSMQRSDYLNPNRQEFGNISYCPWNYVHRTADFYNRRNGTDLKTINYDSVHNTIREARAFSLQLLQILEKYEKANREFESMSQKLRPSHESLVANNSSENEPYVKVSKAVNESGYDKTHVIRKPQLHKEEPTNDRHKVLLENKAMDNMHQQSEIFCKTRDMETLSSYIFKEVCKKLSKGLDELEMKSRYKKYRKLIKRAVKIAKRFNSNAREPASNANIDASISYDTEPEKLEIEQKIPVDLSKGIERIKQDTKIDHNSLSSKTNTIISDTETLKTLNATKEIAVDKELLEYNSLKGKSSGLSKAMQLLATTFGDIDLFTSNTLLNKSKLENGNAYEEKRKSEIQVPIIPAALPRCMTMDSLCIRNDSERGPRPRTLIRRPIRIPWPPLPKDEPRRFEESKEFPITKKNFSLNTLPLTRNKGVAKFPILQFDIKEAIESISMQTTNFQGSEAVPKPSYQNKALANLQVEVNNLLNMPQLQSQVMQESEVNISSNGTNAELISKDSMNGGYSKTWQERQDVVDKEIFCLQGTHSMTRLREFKNFMNIPIVASASKSRSKSTDVEKDEKTLPSIASTKSSSDAMKITFQSVRRISDHTILVKWNPPQITKGIKGYELLVDGRAVKVLNPGRCLAVVSCLPHSERLLLTVRCVTATGHYPATTIVYRPRGK